VLADRAYDADSLYELVLEQGGEPVMPPRRHRKYQHPYDRIATRYDKLAKNFLGFVKLAITCRD